MIVLHGAGEHSEQYSHIGSECPQRQIGFIAPDARGFGYSEGPRGHIRRFREYLDDLDRFIVYFQAKYPKLPFFLVGYSLGGLIAIRYVQQYCDKINGAVLISPALALHPKIPKVVERLVVLLARVTPALPLELVRWNESLRNVRWFRPHLPAWTSELLKDRMATITYSPRWFSELILNGSKALSEIHRFQCPTLCIYDRNDPIVNSAVIGQFFENITCADKESTVYARGKHQFLHDGEVIGQIFQWLSWRR